MAPEKRKPRQAPTTDQLRNDIDTGRTGEKVNWPDPAAAPLGADAEAGGAPPGEAERIAEAHRTAHRGPSPSMHRDTSSWPYWLAVGVIALVLGAAIAWLR